MSILNYEYVKYVFDNTNYFKILLNRIQSRKTRKSFERIIGLIFNDNQLSNHNDISVNGNIKDDQIWGRNYYQYLIDTKNSQSESKIMSKIWVGRGGEEYKFNKPPVK